MVPLKAIFFDAAGTLFNSVRPIGETYFLLAKRYGMEASPEEIKHRFHTCYASMPPLAFPETKAEELAALEYNWWKELVSKIFEPYGKFNSFDDYFDELFTYFAKSDSWSLYPETSEVLDGLKHRGFVLSVISNFDSRVFGILDGLGVGSRFDSVVISSRAGYAKPQAEIFSTALERHNLKKEEALHVGDSLENDVLGANRAGLKSLWIDRDGHPGPENIVRIRDLREIFALVPP